jgi:hypothetical protein
MEDLVLRSPGRAAFWRERRVFVTGSTGLVGASVLGWRPVFGIDEGPRRTAAWYRDHLKRLS